MPGGPEALGIVYFAAVKFAGYTAAASFLKRRYGLPGVNAWAAGGVRTAIGLVVGVLAVFFASQLDIFRNTPAFFVLLVPTRIAEWLLLLWLFFERPDWSWRRALTWAALGTVWSFILDVPAILSVFLLPGGMWIC
jgi:hypothetical protein